MSRNTSTNEYSGTITAGGTSQTLMPANPSRNGLYVQNQSSGDLYIRFNGGAAAASPPSLKLMSGAYYETPPDFDPQAVITIFGAATGQAFAAGEW